MSTRQSQSSTRQSQSESLLESLVNQYRKSDSTCGRIQAAHFNDSEFHIQSTEGRTSNDCQKAEHCSVKMDRRSYTGYVIVIVFMCNSIVSDNIGVSNTSCDQWRLAISVSTRTTSDVSTRVLSSAREVNTRASTSARIQSAILTQPTTRQLSSLAIRTITPHIYA